MLLNKDKTLHERFGELAALAAIGEVSADEYQELQTHLNLCTACREEYADYSELLLQHLPLAHDGNADNLISSTEIHNFERLGSSPARQGTFLPSLLKLWQGVPVYVFGFALFWLLTIGVLLVTVRNIEQKSAASIAHLNDEISKLRSDASRRTAEVSANLPTESQPSAKNVIAQAEYSEVVEQNRTLQQHLATALGEARELQTQVALGQKKENAISTELSETVANLNATQTALVQIKNELGTSLATHSQDSVTIAQEQSRLHDTQEQLLILQSMIDRDTKLLAADRDIRDLMGARNLRIVDVFDIDGKGKTNNPFGRVFFTEGKSLIFYAFGLQDARPGVQSAAYQAWGFEDPYRNEAHSLGIFYQDDKNANRWVLKFDDPNVLNGIDSVFVTVEPSGGSKKPTGTKLLAAYLKADLNHP